MTILTIVCWIGWLMVIFLIKPAEAGLVGFVLFYFSLFLAILGTGSIIGFVIRARLNKKPLFIQTQVAFRQAIWLGLFIITILFLRQLQILRWWNALLLLVFFVILELIFILSRKKYRIE